MSTFGINKLPRQCPLSGVPLILAGCAEVTPPRQPPSDSDKFFGAGATGKRELPCSWSPCHHSQPIWQERAWAGWRNPSPAISCSVPFAGTRGGCCSEQFTLLVEVAAGRKTQMTSVSRRGNTSPDLALAMARACGLELNRVLYFIPVKSLTPDSLFTPEEFRSHLYLKRSSKRPNPAVTFRIQTSFSFHMFSRFRFQLYTMNKII